MLVRILTNADDVELPKYATDGSAGMDIRAAWRTSVWRGEREIISTGLYVAVPKGYELQIRPRSGLAAKEGITVLNSPGTIDSDYRGEIKVILQNHSGWDYIVEKGERIAQMVLQQVPRIEWEVVGNLDDTDRGEGGLGHSGKD